MMTQTPRHRENSPQSNVGTEAVTRITRGMPLRLMLASLFVCSAQLAFGQAIAPERSPRDLTQVPIAPNVPKPQPQAIPTVPTLTGVPVVLPGRKVLPEGTFLSGLVGTLVRSSRNDIVFVPDAQTDTKDPSAQPLVILQCQRLSQLDAATKSLDAQTQVVLSGQVYVYQGRHYVLPSGYSVRPRPRPPVTPSNDREPETAPTPDAPSSGSTTGAQPTGGTQVDELIRELEDRGGGNRLIDPTPLTAEADPAATEAAPVVAEGTLISNRAGRLVRSRSSAGRVRFAFDNDPDSPSSEPMVILPCAQLTAMEAVAATRGEDVTFRISGRVLVYEGQNYLLPIMFRARQPDDIKSLQ